MTGILNKSELQELTGFIEPDDQIEALKHMGISYRPSEDDGSPIVTTADVFESFRMDLNNFVLEA